MALVDIQERLQRLVSRQVTKSAIHNLVIGVRSRRQGFDAAVAAGVADAHHSVAMKVETPYYLASITKMYTATVLMKLVGEGSIELDDPVSRYLDQDVTKGIHVIDGIDHGDEITVSHLLSQTSGLADYFDGKARGGTSLAEDLKNGHDRQVDIGDITDIVRRLPPKFAPGTGKKASYSDTNYALLGAAIEKITSKSMVTNFEERIFTPLGLDTTYVFDHREAQSRPADPYFKDRSVDIPLAMSSFAPDGGIVSTLADSLRFLEAFFGGELLDADQIELMTQRWRPIFFPLEYGFGLMRYKPPRWMSPFAAPPELIGHSGSTGSFAFYNPERDVFLAGTVNQMDNPGRPYRLASQVMALVQ